MRKLTLGIGKLLNHKLFLVLVVIACLYTQGRQSDKYFGWSNPKNTLPEHGLTIHTDGSGYYAYLPQWFIYSDQPHFQFLEGISTKHKTVSFISGVGYDYEKHYGTNKYYIGTAICTAPFFLGNHLIQKIAYGGGDGYSKSYQFTIAITALFYWLLGIWGFIKLMKKYGLPNFSIALLLFIISLGTNLNFYTTYFPSFSHVYSFCAITWFLYTAYCWGENKNMKNILYLGILLGMIFLIRPTNSLIILIVPFFFKSWNEFISTVKKGITNNKMLLSLGILAFLFLVFLQVYTIHSQTGKWAINTYTTEHFDFLTNPKWPEVLFGYRKGFFTYAPVMLLLIPAIFFLLKKGRYFLMGWTIVFILFLYLTSSWWCWWYGGGLGMRPFIDYLPFLCIPIALMLKHISTWLRATVVLFSFFMIYFYQVLQIQFNLNIVHYDIMTKESYWRIFLKKDKRFAWMLHFKESQIPENSKEGREKFIFNPATFKWNQHPLNGETCVLDVNKPDPYFVFHPDSSWSNAQLGINLSGEMKISNIESNPAFDIQLYRNGKILKKIPNYIGYDLDEIDVLLPFSRDYAEKINYSKIDSISICLSKGIPPTSIRNLQFTFYKLKSKGKM